MIRYMHDIYFWNPLLQEVPEGLSASGNAVERSLGREEYRDFSLALNASCRRVLRNAVSREEW